MFNRLCDLFLSGQFWNIPVTVEKYNGPLRPDLESSFNRDILYLITITPNTEGGEMRSFLGELHDASWDRKSGEQIFVLRC